MTKPILFDKLIPLRIQSGVYNDIIFLLKKLKVRIINKSSPKYESVSHFIRCAIKQQLKLDFSLLKD